MTQQPWAAQHPIEAELLGPTPRPVHAVGDVAVTRRVLANLAVGGVLLGWWLTAGAFGRDAGDLWTFGGLCWGLGVASAIVWAVVEAHWGLQRRLLSRGTAVTATVVERREFEEMSQVTLAFSVPAGPAGTREATLIVDGSPAWCDTRGLHVAGTATVLCDPADPFTAAPYFKLREQFRVGHGRSRRPISPAGAA